MRSPSPSWSFLLAFCFLMLGCATAKRTIDLGQPDTARYERAVAANARLKSHASMWAAARAEELAGNKTMACEYYLVITQSYADPDAALRWRTLYQELPLNQISEGLISRVASRRLTDLGDDALTKEPLSDPDLCDFWLPWALLVNSEKSMQNRLDMLLTQHPEAITASAIAHLLAGDAAMRNAAPEDAIVHYLAAQEMSPGVADLRLFYCAMATQRWALAAGLANRGGFAVAALDEKQRNALAAEMKRAVAMATAAAPAVAPNVREIASSVPGVTVAGASDGDWTCTGTGWRLAVKASGTFEVYIPGEHAIFGRLSDLAWNAENGQHELRAKPRAGSSEESSASDGEGLDTRLVVFPNGDLFFGLFEHTGVGIYLSKTTGEYVGNCRFGLPPSRAFAYTKVLTAAGFAIGEQAEWTLNLELTDGWFFRGTGCLDLEKKHVQPTRYGFLTHPLRGTFAGSFQGGWPSNGAFADLIGSPERGERVVRIINSATRYIITSEYIDKTRANLPWADRWWDGDKAILWQPGGRLSVWDHDAGVMLRVFGNVACATESNPERKQRELDGFEAQAAQEARDVEIARVKAAWDVEYARVRAERQRQEDANTPTYTWTEADVFARRVQGAGNSSSLGECSACGGRGELQIAMKTVDVWSPVFGWQKQMVQSETCTLCNGTGRH